MKVTSNEPIQIAKDIYWVGHNLPDDPFQCHVYLIKNGKNSILIDPGSKLTFKETLNKIEKIIPFSYIKYIICHHQDPDITGALYIINEILNRDDAVIISHWRAIALLKHYGLNIPFECVEKNNWKLNADGRELEFIFTPYCHFPGAFCTYDKKTKTLFSSDLFGGFTEEWSLFAEDMKYFDSISAFHEHYMPAKEILFHNLTKIEKYDIEMIAPQHGSIIKKNLIKPIIASLKNLDCGLFLLTQTNSEIEKLRKLNIYLSRLLQSMATYKTFSELVKFISYEINNLLNVNEITYYVYFNDKHFSFSANRLVLDEITDIDELLAMLGNSNKSNKPDEIFINNDQLFISIFDSSESLVGFIKINLTETSELTDEVKSILIKTAKLFEVALEREFIRINLEKEKDRYYKLSTFDHLTGCHSRHYLSETIKRIFALHDRKKIDSVSFVMLDIDDFKYVNDTFGHDIGDIVLKKIGDILRKYTREGDVVTRFGGEEFLIMTINETEKTIMSLAERIRNAIENTKWDKPLENSKITASFGVAFKKLNETYDSLLRRVDKMLYESKKSGKNCITLDTK